MRQAGGGQLEVVVAENDTFVQKETFDILSYLPNFESFPVPSGIKGIVEAFFSILFYCLYLLKGKNQSSTHYVHVLILLQFHLEYLHRRK